MSPRVEYVAVQWYVSTTGKFDV